MKDIVKNRQKLTLAQKARMGLVVLKENGLIWTGLLSGYYLFSSAAEVLFKWMDQRRRKKGLPGINSRTLNYEIWRNWDWSAQGEEWTPSPEWKTSLVAHLVTPHMGTGHRILEIGPGAGRWTEYLQKTASQLVAVDISDRCIELCRERFAQCPNVEFHVNDGTQLPFLADQSVDRVWSFDVFVHINELEAAQYIREIARVLTPGGLGVIHHGKTGGQAGGWRSNLTLEAFNRLLHSAGMEVIEQLESWTDGETRHEVGLYDDVATVFKKP